MSVIDELSVITEKDLLRQVASNITKQHMINNYSEKTVKQGKELMI